MNTFDKARAFMYRNARPVDLSRWRFHFEGGSAQDVLACLSAYQNADGGFGHALEADCWNPHSSPIQTCNAIEILREIGFADAQHPLIAGILRYLASGAHFDGRVWLNEVPENNDHPHAPWWHWDGQPKLSFNPSACLAGFALRFAAPDSPLYALAQRIAADVRNQPIPNQDMHELLCHIRLAQYAGDAIGEDLRAAVAHCLTKDTAEWDAGYVAKPSQFFYDPSSPFYEDCADLAQYEYGFIERTQLADGSWPIPWSWSEYPEQWAIAKHWWKGHGAIVNMLFLKGMRNG